MILWDRNVLGTGVIPNDQIAIGRLQRRYGRYGRSAIRADSLRLGLERDQSTIRTRAGRVQDACKRDVPSRLIARRASG